MRELAHNKLKALCPSLFSLSSIILKGRSGCTYLAIALVIILTALPGASLADKYTEEHKPPYDSTYTSHTDIGIGVTAKASSGANKDSGAVGINCSAWVGGCTAEAWQRFQFFLPADSSVNAKVRILYVGGAEKLFAGAFAGTAWQWQLDNGPVHRNDIQPALSWEIVLENIIDFALDLLGEYIDEAGEVVGLIQTISYFAELESMLEKYKNAGKGEELIGTFNFTAKTGYHTLRVGIRGEASGVLTGAGFAIMVAQINKVEFTVNNNYSGSPDLVIQDIELPQKPPQRGDTCSLKMGIMNIGEGVASSAKYSFYVWEPGAADKICVVNNKGDYDISFQPHTTIYRSPNYTFSKKGRYDFTAVADPSNNVSESNELNNYLDKWIYVIGLPPNKPTKPVLSSGTTVYRNNTYTITTSATDPDGDDGLNYRFRIRRPGDVNSWYDPGWKENNGWRPTGSLSFFVDPTSRLVYGGTFLVSAQAIDSDGLLSQWSDDKSFLVIYNTPPPTPYITGPTQGTTADTLSFTACSIDNEDDEIQCWFNWGDGSSLNPLYGPAKRYVTGSHKFAKPGTFTVQARATDGHAGGNSGWGTHQVTITQYVPPQGSIVVTTDNNDATFTITGKETFKGSGFYWTTKATSDSYYDIVFGDVTHFNTPPSSSKYLVNGKSITFDGRYTHKHGKMIEVTTNLPDASFTVRGSKAAQGEEFQGKGRLAQFPSPYAGDYTIFFDPVTGYCLPSTQGQTQTLEEDGVLIFYGRYVLSPIASLKISTKNIGFAVVNDEAVGFDGSLSRQGETDLPIVKYRFDFGDGIIYDETEEDAPDGAYDGKTWHVYAETGTYVATLTVYDSYGNTNAVQEYSVLLVKEHPRAQQFAGPMPAIAGETVGFKGWGTDIDGDEIIAFEWKSSIDGNLPSEANFSTDRLTPGLHTLSLRVQDSDKLWSDWTDASYEVVEARDWPMFKQNQPRLSWQGAYWGRLNGRLNYASAWTYSTPAGSIVNSPVAANLDGDWTNGLEIAFATTLGTLEIIDSAGNQLWSRNIGFSSSTPAVDDINGDGFCDVVVGSNNGVYAFDANGNNIYTFNAPIAGLGFSSAPVLADIDRNPINGKETVIGGQDGSVYALRNNGIPLWVFPCPGGSFLSSAAVAEIEPNRPGLETVIGGMNGTIYVLDSMGGQITSFPTPWPPGQPKPPITTTAAIADLNTNALGPEIVFGSDDGHLYCLTYHEFALSLLWTYPAPGQPPLPPIGSSPAIGFVGESGSTAHVVFGCDNGMVYVLQGHNGVCIGTFNCGPGVMVRSTPAIANIDTNLHASLGDLSEVIFGATNGNLYAVSFAGGAGMNLPWSPINIGGGATPIFSSPAVADIDHDPDLEILIGAGNNFLHVIKAAKLAALVPIAQFTTDCVDGNAPLTVTFTDQSMNNPLLWFWDYGDGCFSIDQNPQHTYENPGTYDVSLTATNAHGTNTVTKSNYITVNAVPVAAFTLSPADGTVPLTVTFTDHSLYEPTSWLWTFGDGETSTQANPSHNYTEPGFYTVSLTVANAHGLDTTTKTDCIAAQAPIPKADFTQSANSGKVPFTVNFTDLSTGDPNAWLWNFGDAATDTMQNPSHTYLKPGSYIVSLTVSNSRASDTKTNLVPITVSPQTDSVMIPNVPDNNQPPTQMLDSTLLGNFSAPFAAANITEYWDYVVKSSNAVYVNAGLLAPTAAEYIGYFMDTSNTGSADRGNGKDNHRGAYTKDILSGLFEFVRWDVEHPYHSSSAPPTLPEHKKGHTWEINIDYTTGWNLYKTEIDARRPLVIVFRYWNPKTTETALTNPDTGEEIFVFTWGAPLTNSNQADPDNPEEEWNLQNGSGAIGHAVTGVGYIENWDADGSGPMPAEDYAVVHDNWTTTGKNIAIPWQNEVAVIFIKVPACKVGFEDLVNFADDWLETETGLPADLDRNNKVDFSDYSIFTLHWGEQCPDDWPLR